MVVKPALANRMYPLISKLLALLGESGYLHLQATKPDTLGKTIEKWKVIESLGITSSVVVTEVRQLER